MREHLPQLEALAKPAPRGDRSVTRRPPGHLAAGTGRQGRRRPWPRLRDPWGKLRLAQKQVALGQGPEALGHPLPLRGGAGPDQPWAAVFWSTLLDADRLQGNRDQAWKDLADYKARFKTQADPAVERLLAGV